MRKILIAIIILLFVIALALLSVFLKPELKLQENYQDPRWDWESETISRRNRLSKLILQRNNIVEKYVNHNSNNSNNSNQLKWSPKSDYGDHYYDYQQFNQEFLDKYYTMPTQLNLIGTPAAEEKETFSNYYHVLDNNFNKSTEWDRAEYSKFINSSDRTSEAIANLTQQTMKQIEQMEHFENPITEQDQKELNQLDAEITDLLKQMEDKEKEEAVKDITNQTNNTNNTNNTNQTITSPLSNCQFVNTIDCNPEYPNYTGATLSAPGIKCNGIHATTPRGSGAMAKPIINNKMITKVNVENGGINYQPYVEIYAEDPMGGFGAEFEPIIEDGVLKSISVSKTGQNYSDKTIITINDPILENPEAACHLCCK